MLLAQSQMETGIYLVFHPSLRFLQKCPESPYSIFIAFMVIQLSGVVELVSGFQKFSLVQHGFVYPQVAVLIPGGLLTVLNFNISIEDAAGRGYGFMYPALPLEALVVP